MQENLSPKNSKPSCILFQEPELSCDLCKELEVCCKVCQEGELYKKLYYMIFDRLGDIINLATQLQQESEELHDSCMNSINTSAPTCKTKNILPEEK